MLQPHELKELQELKIKLDARRGKAGYAANTIALEARVRQLETKELEPGLDASAGPDVV